MRCRSPPSLHPDVVYISCAQCFFFLFHPFFSKVAANIVRGVVMWKKQEWVSSIWKLNGFTPRSQHEGLLLCFTTPPPFFFQTAHCSNPHVSLAGVRGGGERTESTDTAEWLSGIIMRYSRFIPAKENKRRWSGAGHGSGAVQMASSTYSLLPPR